MSQNYQQSIQSAPVQNAPENTQDMIAELKQLKELVDEGILTEEETSFRIIKSKWVQLLNSLFF